MRTLFVVYSILLGSSMNAEAVTHRAPEFNLSAKPKGSGLEIVATSPDRHHFNLKAPMSILTPGGSKPLPPSEAKEQEVHFQIAKPETTDYSVTLYLCDDAKSFCEKHLVIASWDAKTSQLRTRDGTQGEVRESKATKKTSEADGSGFILNNSEEALAQAKKSKMPLLIDFFGIWCPPCNELDEEVFSSPEFREESVRFVKLKLDSDSEASWALKSKYKVGGYPTVIFASAEGEEISRIVGFRNKKAFNKLMKEAWNSRTWPISSLMAEAKTGSREALDRLGLAHLERQEYVQASQLLENSQKHREQYYQAMIGQLEEKQKDPKAAEKLLPLLETSVREFPKTPESIGRRYKLASIYKERKQGELQKRTLTELIQASNALLEAPAKLEDHEETPADLWASIAMAQEELGNTKLAQESWKRAASENRKKISSGRERGAHLELAYCLWKSGDFKEADKIYTKFEEYYPEEFTFYFNHAFMKQEQKRFPEMERLANQALKYSYGDNRLRAAYLVGQAISSQGRKHEALQAVQSVMKSVKVPSDKSIRTHRYFKKLKELEKELS